MRIVVVSPKGCQGSAQELAEALGAPYVNPYKQDWRNYTKYDVVFNYGISVPLTHRTIINKTSAVSRCIDKVATFKALEAVDVPIPAYVTKYVDIPKEWVHVVCRETVQGRGNEGMTIKDQSIGDDIPNNCALYTRYFYHKWEYRIVVFMGKVVGRYRKDTRGDEWDFTLMLKQGFKELDKHCIAAAKALDIDYVGFDVVENEKGEYVFLEANSGCILTPEAKAAIIKHFKQG